MRVYDPARVVKRVAVWPTTRQCALLRKPISIETAIDAEDAAPLSGRRQPMYLFTRSASIFKIAAKKASGNTTALARQATREREREKTLGIHYQVALAAI